MEELNIPIYRGKIKNIKEAYGELSSKEYVKGYVEGYYFKYLEKHYIRTKASSPFAIEIDPTTLSISFKDMLDNEGTRVFTSLSNSGKGGDILASYSSLFGTISPYICVYQNMRIRMRELDNTDVRDLHLYPKVSKVIGIQE